VTTVDSKLASVIDHTLLRPEAEAREVDRLCVEALRFGFAAVCVQPYWVARAARTLGGSRVGIASVVAFPHGASVTEIKVAERRARATTARPSSTSSPTWRGSASARTPPCATRSPPSWPPRAAPSSR